MAIAQELNIGLACVNEITVGLAYKNCALDGCHISLSPKLRQQDWKHISDYPLATKVRVMIFCTAMSKKDESWVHHNNLESMSQSLEYCHPSSPRKKKIQDSVFCWKMHTQEFSGTTEASYTRSTWSKV
jgi:hypothetical protein